MMFKFFIVQFDEKLCRVVIIFFTTLILKLQYKLYLKTLLAISLLSLTNFLLKFLVLIQEILCPLGAEYPTDSYNYLTFAG